MAMNQGHFVAFYTNEGNSPAELWRPTFVRSIGEPPLSWFFTDGAFIKELESDLQSAKPRFRHPTGEDWRYEPEYDEQFIGMCQFCRETSLAVPADSSDEEAMRILGQFQSIKGEIGVCFYERFYIIPRQNLRNPKRSRAKLSNLIKSIDVRDRWAYILPGLRDRVGVFLSDNSSDVESLFEPMVAESPRMRTADWLENCGIIEKW
jgi:hypothetical protein